MKKWLPYLCLLVLTGVGLYVVFGDVLLRLNHYFFSGGGDGLRLYFCAEYFTKYGGKGAYFSGFQYPFGVHSTYLENPLLSYTLHYFNQLGAPLSDKTVAILNGLMFFSFFPAAIFLYSILKKYQLPTSWAIIGAILILFLNPQIDRMHAHYNLAMMYFVPLLWWLVLQVIEKDKKLIYSFLLLVFLTLSGFVHLYYLLISFLFIGLFVMIHFLQNRKRSLAIKTYIHLTISALLPVIIFQIWFQWSLEDKNDVVKYPYGFFEYVSNLQSVFLPTVGAEADFLKENLHIQPKNYEGFAYIGFISSLVALFHVIKFIRKRNFKRFLSPNLPHHLGIFLWVAVTMFIISLGFPKFMGNYLGFIRNFRSLGRLSWIFYYIFSVYSIYFLYKITRYIQIYKKNRISLVKTLSFIALVIWGAESYWNVNNVAKNVKNNVIETNFSAWNTDILPLLKAKNLSINDFQALLALPFFHNGSEKFAPLNDSWETPIYAYAISRQTGLPMIDNYAARTPLSAALQTIQWISNPLIEKEVLTKLPNQKPLLVFISKNSTNEMDKWWAKNANVLAETERFSLYKMEIDSLKIKQKQAVESCLKAKEQFTKYGEFWLSKPSQNIVLKTFGDTWFQDLETDKNCLKSYQKKEEILKIPFKSEKTDSQSIEFSFWIKIDENTHYLPAFNFQLKDANQRILKEQIYISTQITDVWQHWGRANFQLNIPPNCSEIIIQNFDSENLTIDNFLMRPVEIEVYFESNNQKIFNNFVLKS